MNILEKELNALEKSSKLHNSVVEKENNESYGNNNDVTDDVESTNGKTKLNVSTTEDVPMTIPSLPGLHS